MQMPYSIPVRSFVAALVLVTFVAAAIAISSRETAAGLVDDGLLTAQGETPVIGHARFMEIAFETMQIAGQLSGYAGSPKHKNISGKITGNASDLPNVQNSHIDSYQSAENRTWK
ncbi:MAG: hypothetical protein ACOY15_14070 [Pseudomonadota bacterium]